MSDTLTTQEAIERLREQSNLPDEMRERMRENARKYATLPD